MGTDAGNTLSNLKLSLVSRQAQRQQSKSEGSRHIGFLHHWSGHNLSSCTFPSPALLSISLPSLFSSPSVCLMRPLPPRQLSSPCAIPYYGRTCCDVACCLRSTIMCGSARQWEALLASLLRLARGVRPGALRGKCHLRIGGLRKGTCHFQFVDRGSRGGE